MKVGEIEIFPVSDGRFRLDGGAMFGVVPKVLWEKCCPADDRNRIALSVTCLLIRARGKNILVDTGLGGKADQKFEEMFSIERSPTLYASLKQHGLSPEDVHLVINTHLHFDHAGGNTVGTNGDLRAAFPNARYIVQRGEYDDALLANERTRASYRPENITPPKLRKHWELVEGETELVPGVSVVPTAGHTRHHQSIKIESEGQVALFLGDVIPTVSHLPLPYIMGYDLYPLQTLETKRWLLQTACDQRWLLVFEHDPRIQMGHVRRDVEGKYYLSPLGGQAA